MGDHVESSRGYPAPPGVLGRMAWMAGENPAVLGIVTVVVVSAETVFWLAAQRVVARQQRAEEAFEAAAVAEFGEEAATQFRDLTEGGLRAED